MDSSGKRVRIALPRDRSETPSGPYVPEHTTPNYTANTPLTTFLSSSAHVQHFYRDSAPWTIPQHQPPRAKRYSSSPSYTGDNYQHRRLSAPHASGVATPRQSVHEPLATDQLHPSFPTWPAVPRPGSGLAYQGFGNGFGKTQQAVHNHGILKNFRTATTAQPAPVGQTPPAPTHEEHCEQAEELEWRCERDFRIGGLLYAILNFLDFLFMISLTWGIVFALVQGFSIFIVSGTGSFFVDIYQLAKQAYLMRKRGYVARDRIPIPPPPRPRRRAGVPDNMPHMNYGTMYCSKPTLKPQVSRWRLVASTVLQGLTSVRDVLASVNWTSCLPSTAYLSTGSSKASHYVFSSVPYASGKVLGAFAAVVLSSASAVISVAFPVVVACSSSVWYIAHAAVSSTTLAIVSVIPCVFAASSSVWHLSRTSLSSAALHLMMSASSAFFVISSGISLLASCTSFAFASVESMMSTLLRLVTQYAGHAIRMSRLSGQSTHANSTATTQAPAPTIAAPGPPTFPRSRGAIRNEVLPAPAAIAGPAALPSHQPTAPTNTAASSSSSTTTHPGPIHPFGFVTIQTPLPIPTSAPPRPVPTRRSLQGNVDPSATNFPPSASSSSAPLPRITIEFKAARGALATNFGRLRSLFRFQPVAMEARVMEIGENPVRRTVVNVVTGEEEWIEGHVQGNPDPVMQPTEVIHRMVWEGQVDMVPEVLKVAMATAVHRMEIASCGISTLDLTTILSQALFLEELEVKDVTSDENAIPPLLSAQVKTSLDGPPSRVSHLRSLTMTSSVELDSLLDSVQLPSLSTLSLRLHGAGNLTDPKVLLATCFAPSLKPRPQSFRLRGDLNPEELEYLQAGLKESGVSFDYRCVPMRTY